MLDSKYWSININFIIFIVFIYLFIACLFSTMLLNKNMFYF